MTERFEKLFALPYNLYSEGSPIIISAGSLLKDTETGKIIAQIKYHSISAVPIKALKIKVAAYDISGMELEGIDEYQYLDLDIRNGQDFGSNKAIVLPNAVTRSFNITSIVAILSNGTTQSASMPMKALSKSATLISLLKSEELIKQYQLETAKEAVYVPNKEADLWCCACGEWNSNVNCTRCGLDFPTAHKYLDSSLLEPKAEERIVKEQQYQEQQKRVAEEQEKVAKEYERKRKKKTTIFAIVAIAAIVIISGLLYYSSQHKYDEIAGIYALQYLEEAEEAIYEFHEDSIEEYGFNPYSFELEIKGSGKVYGLWFVNDRGSLTPRAATVKNVSEEGVVELDVLDYPNAKVTLTINKETGEATYLSQSRYDSLELSYQLISEELANNGYKECSVEDIRKEISFVQDLFELNSVEAICEKYQDATTEGAKHDLKIDGYFCGAAGTYEIWLDGVWRITFEQGIYDTNTEKQNLIDNLDSVLGKGSYSETLDAYSWESDKYSLQIDYWPHEGVNFFFDTPTIDSSEQGSEDSSVDSGDEDVDNSSGNDAEVVETFISNGRFEFTPRSYIKRFDEADKNANGYNYTYMRMNGETSLFYELAEISGGYENVKSIGLISFVKDIDTTLTIEEDYKENIITKINVLVEDVDYVPSVLVSCMCATDPALDFTTAYNLGMDVVEQAGTEEGYTYNGVNYVVATDDEYYYIIISVAKTSSDKEDVTNTPIDDSSSSKEPTNENPTHTTATLTATETDLYLDGTSQLVYFYVNPSNIDAIVDYTIADESVVEIQRGGWGDNTAQLLFIPVATGETTVTVYIDGYEGCSVNINVSANVDDGVSSGFDFEDPFITSTESEFNLESGNGVTYITAHNITGEYSLSCDVDGSDVVECVWGDWDGDTISLTFIPLDSGNAFVTVYIDGYYANSAITIPVFVP